MFKLILYKIHTYLKRKYISMLDSTYEYERPQIEYNKILNGYICTGLVIRNAYFDIEDLVESLCYDNFVFEFKVDGEWRHYHEFRRVLQDAYMYGNKFVIPEECEKNYSEQELRVLKKLASVGQEHIDLYKKFLSENHMTI